MNAKDWLKEICGIIEKSKGCTLEYPTRGDREGRRFVRASFNEYKVNTHKISKNLSKEALSQTFILVHPQDKEVGFRWGSELPLPTQRLSPLP